MGTIFSSKKDYNRVLAKQPRDPIIISKFDAHEYVKQQPLIGTLSIPDPVRHLSSKEKKPNSFNPPAYVDTAQTAIQPVESKPLSPVVHNLTEKQVVIPDSPYSSRRSLQMFDQQMNNNKNNNNAFVISRSIVNLNDHRRLNNNHFSSFRPNRTIVERNGKHFLTEFRERMEQRYVQVFDDTTGRMRTFEVTDYIPSRTVRPMRLQSQFQPQSNFARNGFNQRPVLPLTPNLMASPATPSSLLDFQDLTDRKNVEREFARHQHDVTVPPSQPQLTTQTSTDSTYNYPDSESPDVYNPPSTPQRGDNPTIHQVQNTSIIAPQRPNNSPTKAPQYEYNASNTVSRHAYDQYSPGSFRQHSPVTSVSSSNESSADSINSQDVSDTETIQSTLSPYNKRANNGRNDVNVSYGVVSEYNSPTPVDPFARPVRTSDHRYARRTHANQYSQPLSRKQGYQANSALDYTPISMAHNRSNQKQYSHRDSDPYSG